MRLLLVLLSWPVFALAPSPSLIRTWSRVLDIPELIIKAAPGVEALALATAWRESKFDPEAVHYNLGSNGFKEHPKSADVGVFQLNDRYYDSWRLSVSENIRFGVAAVRRAHKCGSDRAAAWAYVHGHCRGGGR